MLPKDISEYEIWLSNKKLNLKYEPNIYVSQSPSEALIVGPFLAS